MSTSKCTSAEASLILADIVAVPVAVLSPEPKFASFIATDSVFAALSTLSVHSAVPFTAIAPPGGVQPSLKSSVSVASLRVIV